MLKKIINKLILSCKKATELVEKRQVIGLSLIENIRVKCHLFICKACRSFERQSLLMDKSIGRIVHSSKNETKVMDDLSKKKILEKIRESK